MTVRTFDYLRDTSFVSGQVRGIGSDDLRDLVDTVEANAGSSPAETALTYDLNLSWSIDTDPIARVTLTGNTTITVTGTGTAGRTYRLAVIQDGTGNRTISLGGGITVKGTPVWETAAGAVNLITVDVVNTTKLVMVA